MGKAEVYSREEERGKHQRSWGGGSSDHLTPLNDHRDVKAAMSQVKG